MTQPPATPGVHDFGIPIPDRVHPQAGPIGDRLVTWAARLGLTNGARDEARLRGAGFHLVAARILPDALEEDVELFAQWVTWLLHLDDEQDEGAMGRSPETVHATYAAITAVIEDQPVPHANGVPAVTALADFWPRTAEGMSNAWRRRILAHIHRHRDAFLTQTAHRRNATVPTPHAYPALRRDANGMFMFDLVEVAYRTEIPPPLAATTSWIKLCAASSDITAWCNDVFSLRRETANNEPTNYVTVLRHARACSEQTAVEQVGARIARRLRDLDEAEDAFLAEAHRLEPGAPLDLDRLHQVVRGIRDMPGTNLGWMLASGRYQ